MNYKSQLKGWAVDRVIEMHKVANSAVLTLESLKMYAEELIAFAYVAREDLESTAKDLFELVRNANPGEASIDALIGTLEHIKQDRIAEGKDIDPAAPVTTDAAAGVTVQ